MKKLMALKFFVGLVLSLAIIACPLVFAVVTTALSGQNLNEPSLKYSVTGFAMIAVLTYSLCFGCNVIVRKTARSWPIGILLAGFVLVFPFMLPLGFTDVVGDIGVRALGFYLATILVASIAAFVFALYAAEHDWHLRTNFKELLCVGAALVFVLLMLFSSQVANIRVLDEREIQQTRWREEGTLEMAGNRVIFQGMSYVDVAKKGISLHEIGPNDVNVATPPLYRDIGIDSEGRPVVFGPKVERFSITSHPRTPNALYMSTENGTFYFGIITHFRTEGEGLQRKFFHDKAYLRSYKLVGDRWMAIDELDISDCLTGRVQVLRMAMRLIDDTLVAFANHSCVVVDVTEPDNLKQIDKKIDVIPGGHWWLRNMEPQDEFDVPLIPIEGISIEERIKLSIDLRYQFSYNENDIYKHSMVDAHDGKIAFFSVSEEKVARFDVIRWDQEKAYCRFSAARPFTILESMTWASSHLLDRTFIKNGKLYLSCENTLMVFDVRADRGIRKLGHFVRMDWNIEDVVALEDGKLLLCAWWNKPSGGSDEGKTRYLYLLENPE